jgi:membrane protein
MENLPSVGIKNTREYEADVRGLGIYPAHKTVWQWVRNLFPNLRDAAVRWSEDDAGSMAASVAYYLALSFFPMILLLISGLGLFLKFTRIGQDARQQLLDLIGQQGSPAVEQTLRQLIQQFENQSIVSGPSGLIAAILAAIGVFAQLDRGFDRVWRVGVVKSKSLHQTVWNVVRHRFSAFIMLVSLGGLIAGIFVAGMVFSQVRSALSETSIPYFVNVIALIDFSFIIGVNTLLFALIYKFLPKKLVPWKYAFRGGLLTACVWEIGRYVLGAFLIGMRYTSAYGAIGSFIALLLWCYYAMSIIFFGAEYVQVLQRRAEKQSQSEPDINNANITTEQHQTIPLRDDSPRPKQRPRAVSLDKSRF